MTSIDQLIAHTKVVILAAGGAKRMMPLSSYITKPLLPIGDTPLLGRIIDHYFQAGFRDFIIVYGFQEEKVLGYIQSVQRTFAGSIRLVKQPGPIGMADAVLLARSFFSPEELALEVPFYVTAGDILFASDKIRHMFETHVTQKALMTLALAHSTDPNMAIGYGNVDFRNGRVMQIIEKPGQKNRIGDYYSEPMYVFNTSLFPYLELVTPSSRGERELQDGMMLMMNSNAIKRKHQFVFGENVIDHSINIPEDGSYHLTYPRDFLAMNFRWLRENINYEKILNKPQIDSEIQLGKMLYYGSNCAFGQHSRLDHSYIFPNVTIGDNSIITNSIIAEGMTLPSRTILDHKIILPNGVFPLN